MQPYVATKEGAIIDGKYEIIKQIGHGGMSVVYLAEDLRLGKWWAVKELLLPEGGREEGRGNNTLKTEAFIMKNLDYPALPRVVDVIEEGPRYYIVMDYVDGKTLAEIVRKGGIQSETDVLCWAKQICKAMSYLHRQNPPIIYRDMKPSNVMVKTDGTIKIIDFGIARQYRPSGGANTIDFGTRGYASPEHYGMQQTDMRSDVYTLGMTMHYLLSGRDPTTEGYVYQPVLHWNSQVSPELSCIIDKCTQYNPKDRYQTMDQLLLDLEDPAGRMEGEWREQKKQLYRFTALVVLAVIFFVACFGCRLAAAYVGEKAYDALLSVSESASAEERREAYIRAIHMYPENTAGYEKLLQVYEEDGVFDKEESEEFLSVYNTYRSCLDHGDGRVATLKYQIGVLYFSSYTEEESVSVSARVQKAYVFFAENEEIAWEEGAFEQETLSSCYYCICSFYKQYVLQSTKAAEANAEDYDALLCALEETLEAMSGEGATQQLALYNGIFAVLYDQRTQMAKTKVPKERVLALLQTAYEKAADLQVQRDASLAFQEEILENYEAYCAAIERAYDSW